MNMEKMKELLKKAKETAVRAETRELAESFEEFLDLYTLRNDPESKGPEFSQKLLDCHHKLWEKFENTAKMLGMTPQALKDHVQNPTNFSLKEWRALEDVKQDLATKSEVATKTRKQKLNTKVKI
jgi:hypothetical protein